MPGDPVVKKAEGISRGFRLRQDFLAEEDGEADSPPGREDAGAIGRETGNLVEAVPWGAGELGEALGFCLGFRFGFGLLITAPGFKALGVLPGFLEGVGAVFAPLPDDLGV